MEKYAIIAGPDAKETVTVKRASDGLVARCKLAWLEQVTETTYQAKSKTKALRMDGLDWEVEG